jgi:histidinol-phosphatase (PHP family)
VNALCDLHVHSTLSADGISTLAEHAARAAELGLQALGFAEHADFDPRDRSYGFLDPEDYAQQLAAAQRAHPGVQLLRGVEVTYQSTHRAEIRQWLGRYGFDFCILSVHLVEDHSAWAMVSEEERSRRFFASRTERRAYAPYFAEVLAAVEASWPGSGGMILGHLDLVKRYGVREYGPFDEAAWEGELRSILRAAVERGVALEINTSGLRQSPKEPYPTLTVVRWFREEGGELLTLGSDAHRTGDLASGVSEAAQLALAAGFRAVAFFEGGQVRWIDLV